MGALTALPFPDIHDRFSQVLVWFLRFLSPFFLFPARYGLCV